MAWYQGKQAAMNRQRAARQLQFPDLARASGQQKIKQQHQAGERQPGRPLGQRRQRTIHPRMLQLQLAQIPGARRPPNSDDERARVRQHRHQTNGANVVRAGVQRHAQLKRNDDQLWQRHDGKQRDERIERRRARPAQAAPATACKRRLVGREQRQPGVDQRQRHRHDERHIGHRLPRDQHPLRRGGAKSPPSTRRRARR